MACNAFTNALAWAQKPTTDKEFEVVVYFTKQFGYGENYAAHKDTVIYASGEVYAQKSPTPHLKGTLYVAINNEKEEMISYRPEYTCDVDIFEDGKVNYLMRLNGTPMGGIPIPTTVQTACVNGVLLTGASGSEVVTIGFARKTQDIPK